MGSNRYDIDLDLLKEMYEGGYKREDIADALFVSSGVIQSRINEMGLHRTTLKKLPLIPKEVIIKEYITNNRTMEETSEYLDCSMRQVRNSIKEYGIKTKRMKDYVNTIEKNELYKKYVEENKSIDDVAVILGVCRRRVREALVDFNIPIKSQGLQWRKIL